MQFSSLAKQGVGDTQALHMPNRLLKARWQAQYGVPSYSLVALEFVVNYDWTYGSCQFGGRLNDCISNMEPRSQFGGGGGGNSARDQLHAGIYAYARSSWHVIKEVISSANEFYIFIFNTEAAMEEVIEAIFGLFKDNLCFCNDGIAIIRQEATRAKRLWFTINSKPCRGLMRKMRSILIKVLSNAALLFSIEDDKGIKAGDPISPYLFVLVTEERRLLFIQWLGSRKVNSHPADVNGETKAETARSIGYEGEGPGYTDTKYPSGEFVFKQRSAREEFLLKTRLFFALPWERFEKGSVLKMILRGEITDQLKSFPRALSLPQICENFEKAAYDPRLVGIYLHIDTLNCGWGKLEEIRRHILNFKKSGKFITGYVPACGVKEYYIGCACDELYAPPSAYVGLYGLLVQASFLGGVLEKVGIEAQVERIGKYKTLGDQLTRKSMSDENREMLTALLDNMYSNWLDKISLAKGKKKEDIENFINEGVYQVERMKQEGLITDIKYDDEVMCLLRKRLGIPNTKRLPTVGYRKYSSVRRWTLGLTGYEDQIAIIRASGSISRTQGRFRTPSSRIIAEQFIEKIRSIRVSKKYKAFVIRIDSPGGDALASDLMWREIKLLAATKPVIASLSDVAASGGYYMAMAADAIVAEHLTLTGSIGVVTGKINVGKLYEHIGFSKEIISRGRYAELAAAEHRPLRADEAELFAKRAQDMYKQFRDKAAFSRSMSVDKMEQAAQGRVWTGHDAASLSLVDAIGGLARAVAIAKQKANIPLEKQGMVLHKVINANWTSSSPLEILRDMGNTFVEADEAVKDLIHEMTSSDAIQARMDGILFEKLEGATYANSALALVKNYLSFSRRCWTILQRNVKAKEAAQAVTARPAIGLRRPCCGEGMQHVGLLMLPPFTIFGKKENARRSQGVTMDADSVARLIMDQVRMKITSVELKDSLQVSVLYRLWGSLAGIL
ncbi:Serine protease SPPA, chloroplastic [Sesamum angolense]|uniref:Serine protease SPPA, chloroplastic n=1 Tax=Sesamum angolense TaxID=2727404 RepID=A0AAE2C569_9LAMI|nr:Serine protease SPPA, chloroplastic [Sesamum angolense]